MVEWGPFGAKAMEFITRPIEQDARINILEGAVRSQKTFSMIPKWINYVKCGPKGLLIMTGKSKDTIYDNVLRDIFDTVGRNNHDYNSQKGNLVLFGRRIKVIGAKDEGSEAYLRGKTGAGAYCDEMTTTPKSFLLQLLNRLSVEDSKLYGTTNPDNPYHYLYTDFITNKKMIDSGMVNTIHFELDDNPTLSEEYKTFIRSAYTGLFYQRFVLGLWVLAEGAIYDMFDKSEHCITADQLPDRFSRNMIGIDVGASNPTVFLKIGVTFKASGLPEIWEHDEYYHDGGAGKSKTTSQYKRDLVEFMGGVYDGKELVNTPEPYEIYVDPSALSFIIELRSNSCGISLSNCLKTTKNEVLPGINSVATVMSDQRLKIVESKCPHSVKETVTYCWDPKKQLLGEDAPIKQHDHVKDPERYMIHTAFPATKRIMSYALGTG